KLTHAVNEQTSAMTTAMTAMLKQFQANPPPAQVKAVKETCVTCGGAHPYYQCLAAGGNTFPEFRDDIQEYASAAAANYNQGNPGYRPQGVANQMRPPENAPEANKDTVIPTNNGNTEDVQPQAVSSKPPVLTSEPANTPVSASKPNPQASIPYPSRRNDERNREKAKDQIERFYQIFKDMSFKISFSDSLILMPKFASTLKALIGNKEKLSEMARTPLNEHCSAVLLKKLPEKLGDPGKFLIPCDFSGMAECLALADLGASINLMPYSVWKKLSLPDRHLHEVLGFFDTASSGNPTPLSDPIVSATSPTLTPFGESDFLLEEVNAFLPVEDESISSLPQFYLDLERDILLLEALLNDDASSPPQNQRNSLPEVSKELKICEAKTKNLQLMNHLWLNSKLYPHTFNMLS
nr:reverse transcriptase domain-containing protein [Tanacetum cinerariifolium]